MVETTLSISHPIDEVPHVFNSIPQAHCSKSVEFSIQKRPVIEFDVWVDCVGHTGATDDEPAVAVRLSVEESA